MVTNYPRSIAANPTANRAHDDSFNVFDRLRQFMCGLHGHDSLVQFEQDRMYLRCVSCGHETHGWELNESRPHVSIRETHRAPLARPQLIRERKIA
jgi:hypothetical protein